MAKRKAPTKLHQDYMKQRKRIQQAIRRAEKRGYVLEEEILPEIPKKITKQSVSRLQKIDTTKIYSKSVKADYSTGEIVPGLTARKKERSQSSKKAAQTRRKIKENLHTTPAYEPNYDTFPNEAVIVIQNFKADVIAKFPENAGPVLQRWLSDLLNLYGKNDVAQMLEDAADHGVQIDYKTAYNNDLLMGAIADFMDYLPGASTGVKQDLLDALEYDEDWELPS